MTALRIKNLSKKYHNASGFSLSDFSLGVSKGEIHTVVGESGCGKTTLLRLIAGLEEQSGGEIYINEKLVLSASVFVAPEKRNIGFVFQDYALFPHLNVKDNIGFGLNKISAAEKKEMINKYLSLVGMDGYENRYPHELSGGQQQRIAIARSLATEPSLLLLDEPFSNLDEIVKKQMRAEIKKIITKAGATAIFVTHDTKDALAVSDKITVIRNGLLQQSDIAENIYTQPANEYVANMFGETNIVKVICKNGILEGRGFLISTKGQASENAQLTLCIRPEDIEISASGNIKGVVVGTVFVGNKKEIRFDVAGTEWLAYISADANVSVGSEIKCSVTRYSVL